MLLQTFRSACSLTLIGAAVLTIAGCGGSSNTQPTLESSINISGKAATGSAFVEAVVTVIDSRGTIVGTSTPIGTDGAYSIVLQAGAVAPFVLIASRTTADGEVQSLVSMAEKASESITVNLTPITNLIAARLSASGDPSKLAAELQAGTAQITAEAITATVAEVKAILSTLLAATGTTDTDPISGTFAVDGTGYDRLLDSISISIQPSSATSTNIEIAVKQVGNDETTQPTVVTFSSEQDTVSPLPTIDPTTLVESGTSVKIADFLTRLTACYAIPTAERIAGEAVTNDACKSVFFQNDPTNFKSNGNTVSSTGAFASLFNSNAVNVVFSQGTYEFTRANAERDIIIGYKSRDSQGNENFDTFVLRNDANNKLNLIGNQYRFPGAVTPYQQYRQFATLDQSAYNYRSVGYTLHVDNKTESGSPIFSRVEVITPKGNTLTLKPTAGSSFLPLVKNGRVLGTNYLRLQNEFVNSNTNADLPTMEPGLFFSNTAYDDNAIAKIPSQSVWTFRYFLADNLTDTPDAVQNYKTRNRAMTISEFKLQTLSQLGSALVSSLANEANPNSGRIPLPTDDVVNLGDPAANEGWTVPAGALPATQVTLFGALFDMTTNPWTRVQGFNDSSKFGSTARTTTVRCSKATANDQHCGLNGTFAPGSYADGIHLWARDANGREFANFYAAYKLTTFLPLIPG